MAFSVTCPSCGKSFQLADEIYERKVAGKVVSIKCKQCQAGIRIDATEPGGLKVVGATPAGSVNESVGQKPPAPATPVRARQPTLIGMMGPAGVPITKSAADDPPAPEPPPPPAAEGALWAVDSGGKGEDRELDDLTIAREITTGKLLASTLVWRDGMGDWLEVSKVPQLARLLPSAKKAVEAPKVAAPLPARAKQPSAPGLAAPAAPPPAPPAPPPPPAPPRVSGSAQGAAGASHLGSGGRGGDDDLSLVARGCRGAGPP